MQRFWQKEKLICKASKKRPTDPAAAPVGPPPKPSRANPARAIFFSRLSLLDSLFLSDPPLLFPFSGWLPSSPDVSASLAGRPARPRRHHQEPPQPLPFPSRKDRNLGTFSRFQRRRNRCGGGWAFGYQKGGKTAAVTAAPVAMAAPSGGGAGGCLDCLQDVVRALAMGSCLPADQRPLDGTALLGKGGGCRRREEEAPGRIAGNGAGNAACLFTRQGKKGTNQDAMVAWENFNGRSDTVFCGVFDGHGPHGHLVARTVRDTLPSKLCDLIYHDYGESPTSNQDGSVIEEILSPYADADNKSPTAAGQKEEQRELFDSMKESFRKAFRVTDKELKLHRNIDSICSGTTAVTLIKQGQDLIVGNLGDSRAVLGTRDQNGRLVAHQLTVDLKPDHPREARRIKRCNGRVFAHQDEPDVARLWLPNCNSPGLAMARAFGDFCLKDFGLICVPEVSYRQITEKDEFIVLATDGVWDVLSNQEVVDVVASCSGHSAAARTVVDLANQTWKFKYPTSKTDDCAAVCLFLNKDAEAGELSGHSVANKGTGSGPRMPPRLKNPRYKSKKFIPEDAEDECDSNISGDERSLEGFTRLNTLLVLPKFGDTSPTKK